MIEEILQSANNDGECYSLLRGMELTEESICSMQRNEEALSEGELLDLTQSNGEEGATNSSAL